MVKLLRGRWWEEPLIFVFIAWFGLWLDINNVNQRAGRVLLGLALIGGLLFFIRFLSGQKQLLVNNVSNNTGKSIVIGLVIVAITVIASIAFTTTMGSLNLQGGSITNWDSFWEFNRQASLGADVSPLANNPWLNLFIFGVAFAVAETVIILQAFDLMLSSFNIPLDIKNPLNWLIAVVFGGIAILYHIYAKSTSIGKPNINSLIIIGFIFTVQCLAASYTQEKEASIWGHIFNNMFALVPTMVFIT